jgi:hypothetical protein
VSGSRCEAYRELVSAFVDERLEGEELLRLESHLEICPGCRAFEAGLRRFGQLLRATEAFRPLRRPPPGFAAAVAARAVTQAPASAVPFPAARAARRPGREAWLGLAAAAAAALLFAWSWQRLLPGDAPGARQAARTPAAVAVVASAADEGSMDAWMREHAMVARDGTLLGPAEEVEFASFHAAADAGR